MKTIFKTASAAALLTGLVLMLSANPALAQKSAADILNEMGKKQGDPGADSTGDTPGSQKPTPDRKTLAAAKQDTDAQRSVLLDLDRWGWEGYWKVTFHDAPKAGQSREAVMRLSREREPHRLDPAKLGYLVFPHLATGTYDIEGQYWSGLTQPPKYYRIYSDMDAGKTGPKGGAYKGARLVYNVSPQDLHQRVEFWLSHDGNPDVMYGRWYDDHRGQENSGPATFERIKPKLEEAHFYSRETSKINPTNEIGRVKIHYTKAMQDRLLRFHTDQPTFRVQLIYSGFPPLDPGGLLVRAISPYGTKIFRPLVGRDCEPVSQAPDLTCVHLNIRLFTHLKEGWHILRIDDDDVYYWLELDGLEDDSAFTLQLNHWKTRETVSTGKRRGGTAQTALDGDYPFKLRVVLDEASKLPHRVAHLHWKGGGHSVILSRSDDGKSYVSAPLLLTHKQNSGAKWSAITAKKDSDIWPDADKDILAGLNGNWRMVDELDDKAPDLGFVEISKDGRSMRLVRQINRFVQQGWTVRQTGFIKSDDGTRDQLLMRFGLPVDDEPPKAFEENAPASQLIPIPADVTEIPISYLDKAIIAEVEQPVSRLHPDLYFQLRIQDVDTLIGSGWIVGLDGTRTNLGRMVWRRSQDAE